MTTTLEAPNGETVTVPRYRVTFQVFSSTRQIVVEGNKKAHLYGRTKDQVHNAVQQARVLCALEYGGLNVGERVIKVEREWESGKGWDEFITARQATPGTEVCCWSVSSAHDGFGVRPSFHWVKVGKWVGTGQGDAILISEEGRHMGLYGPDDVFETR